MNKKFGLIGAAGYIAPRHLKAIKETGNELVVALDKNDSVGVIDNFFPKASFFTEFERFDRHVEMIKRTQQINLDYMSICTPNYLHDAHIRMALRSGAHAICEKPLVLNPWNLDALIDIERQTGKKVYTILQLRHHPSIINLKKQVDASPKDKVFDVDLTYITSRGYWYYASWKGNEEKSGGIASNIGIHFYDMLGWVLGTLKRNVVHVLTHDRAAGYLEFEKAKVKWFLSINEELIPEAIKNKRQRTYRSITVDGKEVEFSEGFTDLHTVSYNEILNGAGFGLEDARKSIEIVYDIKNSAPSLSGGEPKHEFVDIPLEKHPFK